MKTNGILIFVGLLVISVVGFYFLRFGGNPISNNPNDWGPFGDFFGGVLNPIIGGAGLLLLFSTIKQNEKALEQAKEMIEQGQAALELNALEMKASRVELSQATKAQEELARIESENLKHKKILIQQEMYEREVESRIKEINSFLNMKTIHMENYGNESKSFMLYFEEHEPVTLIEYEGSISGLNIMKHIMSKAISLCDTMTDNDLLIRNPHGQEIIRVKKIELGSFFINLFELTDSLQISYKKSPNSKLTNERAVDYDNEYKNLNHYFLKVLVKFELIPFKEYTDTSVEVLERC